jgi:hypothetical protein
MQSSLITELNWLRPSLPAAGGVWTTCFGGSGCPRAQGEAIFLKISTIGNNRWPYAIVRFNRAYRHLVEHSCSKRGVDDVYWLFWRSPRTPGVYFSQNLNDGEEPLTLCNRRFKQSLFGNVRASLQEAVGRRCLFGVWELPGVSGGRFFSKSQR